jgi:hypothetical protein
VGDSQEDALAEAARRLAGEWAAKNRSPLPIALGLGHGSGVGVPVLPYPYAGQGGQVVREPLLSHRPEIFEIIDEIAVAAAHWAAVVYRPAEATAPRQVMVQRLAELKARLRTLVP